MYTHARPLHRNPLLGALQIYAWIFLHPSAWQAFVRQIDPELQADFSLTQLSAAHWKNPALRSVLLRGHLVAPLLVGAFLFVELLLLGTSPRDIAIRVFACVLFGALGGLISAAGTQTAGGMAVGVLGGLCGSLAYAFSFLQGHPAQLKLTSELAETVVDYVRGGGPGSVAMTVGLGAAAGVIFASVGGVVVRPPEHQKSPSGRRRGLGGLFIGLVIGGLGFATAVLSALWLPFLYAVALTGFLAGGIAALQLTRRPLRSLAYGILCGLGNYFSIRFLVPMLNDAVVVGIIVGTLLSAWFVNLYLWAARVGGRLAGAVAGSLGLLGGWILIVSSAFTAPFSVATQIVYGLASGLFAMLLALSQTFWRPLLFYPFEEAWNLVLLRADQRTLALTQSSSRRGSLLRYHAAFFDELQTFALHGLDEHLLLVLLHRPDEGRLALEALSTGPQRWAAQAAQIELDARRLESCADASAIAQLPRGFLPVELEGPASAVLRSFGRISEDVAAALSQSTAHNQRLGLFAVAQKLEALLGELSRSSDPYAERFRPIAQHFRRLVEDRAKALLQAAELLQELDNPYVIGVPLTLQQEIFVGRTDVSARIEQLLLDRRRPPLLLYGQRRMGKTSLLNNLGRLLPSSLVPLFVDLQGPASSASDHAGLLYNLSRGMIESALRQRNLRLPALSREALVADPFTRFDEWLDEVDALLASVNATALLALDELEALERALVAGHFSESAVLGMLRHLIQHRLRWKVLLASSHSLDELVRWSSYLINVQIVHLGYLHPEETRRLVEQPVPDMPLVYDEDAASKVIELTRGHPFLVQLLCSEIVSRKNDQPKEETDRRLATTEDIEAAVLPSLEHGSFFFADIERNQIEKNAADVLRALAKKGESAYVDLSTLRSDFPSLNDEDLHLLIKQLLRRDLIEETGAGYRFQVELIRRYFAQGQSLALS